MIYNIIWCNTADSAERLSHEQYLKADIIVAPGGVRKTRYSRERTEQILASMKLAASA